MLLKVSKCVTKIGDVFPYVAGCYLGSIGDICFPSLSPGIINIFSFCNELLYLIFKKRTSLCTTDKKCEYVMYMCHVQDVKKKGFQNETISGQR